MFILSFFSLFLFLSIYLAVLFQLLYSPIGTLLQFCFPVCVLVSFVLVDKSFWFPLFAGSIYCTLLLLDCFNFAYGYIHICVYSVTLFIVAINLCICVGVLQLCGILIFFLLSFFFHFFFFKNLTFNFKIYYIFSTFILLFAFLLPFCPCS